MFSIIFPGQGSQSVGMAKEFYEKYPLVKSIFSRANEALNFNLSKIILGGSISEINLTKNTQPAIFVASYSIFSVMKKEFNIDLNQANYFAGHSLGEYSALACANSLPFEEAVRLLYARGKFMQEAVPFGKGAMLAILGLKVEKILEQINSISINGTCEIANDNGPGQIVVSGDKDSIQILQNSLKKKSIRGLILPVSAPFHCSLMESAEKKMSQKITESIFKNPKPSIISNVTAKAENKASKIKELLIKQITSRVNWRESIEYMINNGVNEFIEIGPGKVLTGLVRRINKDVNVFNINSIDDITNYINK
ncbi:MAG: [acyl-carrier-protein] S-malonyltransferase [Candidatus Pelagibacter sp.]|jgi:[acyl-carrier-protein] S-malonyltransferase|nr:[acyl-carrier-protein] S-malonyltransferase [Candidatus Pelagibacter sp.]MAH02788.1 [acyl-carrier-protein] S-malonyltransferase [Candidatus Pelagibacter sp.]|tara:strand:- start:11791 stop:12720 length:930 start_codon:yes stop_codon:yes gene_type:complete